MPRLKSACCWVVLTACSQAPTPGTYSPTGAAVLQVGDHVVHRDLVDVALARIGPERQEALGEQGLANAVADGLALGELLYQRGVASGLIDTPTLRAEIALVVRDVVAAAVLDQATLASVTDEAVQQAYDDRRVQWARPAARVRLVMLDDASAAAEVHATLVAGGDVDQVARATSVDAASAADGGDLGWVVPGQLADPLDAVVFDGAEPGVRAPVSVGSRWVVAVVEARRDRVPLAEVRDELVTEVRRQAEERIVAEILAETPPTWLVDPGVVLPRGRP